MNLVLLLSEADRRSLIIGLVILVILLLFVGLFGGLCHYIFERQADRAEGFIDNVVRAHVVNTPKELRKFGFKKNNRALFRDSLWPFLVALIALTTWIIENLATANWGTNIFEDFGDLFFGWDWNADGVIVSFFGLPLIATFPPVNHYPEFHLEHLCHYIECFLFIVAIAWYAYVCQGYIARHVRIDSLSRSIFKSSLKDYKAREDMDVHVTPDKPLPPGE